MRSGPISEPVPSHQTELVERHTITVPVTATELVEHLGQEFADAAVEACRQAAHRWQEAHGVSGPVSEFQRYDAHEDGPGYGVAWEVVIGKAEGRADGPEQWRWSTRWQHWLDVFAGLASRRPAPPPR